MKIALGNDHAGFELKKEITAYLKSLDIPFEDFGSDGERSDYPDYAHAVADAVEKGQFQKAILICGSANGISMTANKHKGVRAAVCWTPEIAKLARQHNDANILALPGRFISLTDAKECVRNFLDTPFEGGRHATRVEKINVSTVNKTKQ